MEVSLLEEWRLQRRDCHPRIKYGVAMTVQAPHQWRGRNDASATSDTPHPTLSRKGRGLLQVDGDGVGEFDVEGAFEGALP